MSQTIQVKDIDGGPSNQSVQFPDKCPQCHSNVAPLQLAAILRFGKATNEIQACFRCPNRACDRLMIAVYTRRHGNEPFSLISTSPKSPIARAFEQTIAELSESFVTIYNQAIEAETYGLDQIVGIGLRKALEFLVKDFAIEQNPGKDTQIKKMTLSQVIATFIADPNLKQVAERAAWLGNDETHYERVWTDMDLDDLKRLIHLSVNWIDNVLTSKAYIDSMPKP
jgi:hypothetical protein